MIYDNDSQRLEDMGAYFSEEKVSYRMAQVTAVTNGRPIIKMNGETTNSSKQYKYLASYTPAVGDYVMVAVIARSYVILGKVV